MGEGGRERGEGDEAEHNEEEDREVRRREKACNRKFGSLAVTLADHFIHINPPPNP